MRLPRVRLSVRKMMAVLAVAALILATLARFGPTGRLVRRSAYYSRRAAEYREAVYSKISWDPPEDLEKLRRESEEIRRRYSRNRSLLHLYERAAWFPWLPDPAPGAHPE